MYLVSQLERLFAGYEAMRGSERYGKQTNEKTTRSRADRHFSERSPEGILTASIWAKELIVEGRAQGEQVILNRNTYAVLMSRERARKVKRESVRPEAAVARQREKRRKLS